MDEERAEGMAPSVPPKLRRRKTPKEILDIVPDGIPKTATFLGFDPDMSTLIVRRFHQLSTRNLLFLEGRVAALQELQRKLDQTDKLDRDVSDADKSWEEFALLGTGGGARDGTGIPTIAFAEWAITRKNRRNVRLPGEESELAQQAKSLLGFVGNLLQSIKELGVQDQNMLLGSAKYELRALQDRISLEEGGPETFLQQKLLGIATNLLRDIQPYPTQEEPRISWEGKVSGKDKISREVDDLPQAIKISGEDKISGEGKISRESDVLPPAILLDIVRSLLQTIQDSMVVEESELSRQETLFGVVRNVLQTIQDIFPPKGPGLIQLQDDLLRIARDSLHGIYDSPAMEHPKLLRQAKLLDIARDLLARTHDSFHRYVPWFVDPQRPESLDIVRSLGVVRSLLQNIQDDLRVKETERSELSQQATSLGLYEGSLHLIQDKWDIAIAVKDTLKEYQEAVLRYREISSLQPPASRSLETIQKWFSRELPLNLQNVNPVGGPFLRESVMSSLFEDMPRKEAIALHVGADDDPVSRGLSRWKWYTNLAGQEMIDGFQWTPEKWIHDAVTWINLSIAIVFLVGATWALWGSEHNDHFTVRLAVLTAWVIIFAAWIGRLTNANRGEVFAATAAYAAVLVVFVGKG